MKKHNWNNIIYTMAIIGIIEVTITAVFKEELNTFDWFPTYQLISYIFFGVFLILLLWNFIRK